MRITLKIRVFALVCALVISSVAAISFFLLHNLADRLHEDFKARGSIIAGYFARNSVEGIIIEDESGLTETIEKLFEIEDIVYASIYDSERTEIVAKSTVYTDDRLVTLNAVSSPALTVDEIMVGENDDIPALDFKVAAVDGHGEIVGWVRVGVSLSRIADELGKMTARSIVLLVVFAGVALIVSFLVANSIANPINEIARAIRAFGEGDWTQTVETTKTDEVGQLATGFNAMARNLEARTDELKRSKEALAAQATALRAAHDELESRVNERTAELAHANTELKTEIAEREQAQEHLKQSLDELARHNDTMTGRETRIAELKAQVNGLLEELGREKIFAERGAEGVPEELASLQGDGGSAGVVDVAEMLEGMTALQGLLGSFCESVGIAAAIIDLEGRVLVGAKWQRICTDFHRKNPETGRRCLESDTVIANRLRDGEGFSAYACKNGLMDAASPIIVNGRHVANLFVGQFLLEPPDVEFFREQAARCGFPEEDYLNALADVPIVDRSKLQSVLAFLREFAVLVGSMEVGQSNLSRANADLRHNREALLSLMEDLIEAREKAEEYAHQAEDASRSKSEFLANMSHEIRTPMTAILGFADVLLEHGELENAPPERIEAARTIKRNGDYLISIINDILDLSKVEAGKMTVEHVTCNPCTLIAEVASLVKVKADGQGLSFNVEYIGAMPETIGTDPTRLRQILINLIGNAIKFTEVGGVRLITRFIDDENNPVLQFDVLDTGIGMTKEQVERLFQPFTQADASTTRKFGGTGLGLTISRRFAEMLGGEITVVDATKGIGTRFRVTIATGPVDGSRMIRDPVSATTVATETDQTHASAGQLDLRDCRVLLAEDGPDNQRLISFVLKKAGAEVTVRENGQLARDAVLAARDEGKTFDVVLMDMQMPVMDGYVATALLRREGYTGSIIALTAHAMAADRKKCMDAGCDDYATKPINRRKLIETVHQWRQRRPVPHAGDAPPNDTHEPGPSLRVEGVMAGQ